MWINWKDAHLESSAISCISINCPPEGSSGSPSHGNSKITDIHLFSVSSIIPPCFPFTYNLQSSIKQDANSQSWLYWSRFSSEKHHRWRENNWFVRETKRSSDGGVHWLPPRLSWIIVRQVRLMIRCEERWCYFIPPPAACTLPLKEGLTFVVAPLRVHPVQIVK